MQRAHEATEAHQFVRHPTLPDFTFSCHQSIGCQGHREVWLLGGDSGMGLGAGWCLGNRDINASNSSFKQNPRGATRRPSRSVIEQYVIAD